MADDRKVSSMLEDLTISDDPLALLHDLKVSVSSLPVAQLKDILVNVSLSKICDLLNTDDNEQIDLCCYLLKQFFAAIDASVVLVQYQNELSDGFNHPAVPVRLLCLSQLERASEDLLIQIGSYTDILNKVLHLLGDEIHVSKEVTKLLKQWCGSRETLDRLFREPLYDTICAVMEKSDVARYRVYELIVDLASGSDIALQQCKASGILEKLVNEIYCDDLLVQLNCLDQLTNIAITEHGLQYLIEIGVLLKLEQMLEIVETDPMVSFLLPGLIKFFGNVARLHPKETFDQYDLFLKTVFSVLDSSDHSLSTVAIETVGFVGRSVQGKIAIARHGANTTLAVRKIGCLMKNSPSDIRSRSILSFANLIHLDFDEQTPQLLTVTESWFNQLQKPMEFISSLATQPFEDLRIPVLTLMQSLSLLPWGQKQMHNHATFNEYLLNRSTEFNKEGKEFKYEIIKTLANSPTAQEIFGNPYFLRLREFIIEGPFYVRAQAEVAFASS